VTHAWERFRALPRRLQLLVWACLAALLIVAVAVPNSSSPGDGGHGRLTVHGAVNSTTSTGPALSSTTATPSPTTAPAPAPAETTTTTTGAPSPESELAELRVAPEGARTGYDRSLFPQWIDADHDGCDTRHEVLIAESVVPAHVGANCAVTGEWYSAYDGVTTTDASTFDIDHVVPLAEAWDSGASAWDAARRTAYANDLDHPQTLRAVSASANREKGDDDPAQWKPPLQRDWCSYATDWISVKVTWNLTADPAEVAALRSMLDTCPGGAAPAPLPPRPTSTATSTPPRSSGAWTLRSMTAGAAAVPARRRLRGR